ncbi:MAG: hypothetical protein ACYTBZ_10820 [Planctomycetota bacterium]|jgi:hypothetical protein
MTGLAKYTRLLQTAILTIIMVAGCKDDIPELPPFPPPASQPEIAPLVYTDIDSAPALQAPHGGRLLEIDNRIGYVEWLLTNGQVTVYFMDTAGNPLTQVSEAVLQIATETGPKRISFNPCEDQDYANACRTASDKLLEQAPPTGVIRFLLNDRGYRVLLPSPRSVTQPAGTKPATNDT